MGNTKKLSVSALLLGLVIGGVLGVSIAFLFTYKPESELREDINVGSKEALENAGEWKESIQDNETDLSAKVKTAGTKVRHKSAYVTKKSLIKAVELKEVVRGNDPETLDRMVNKGNALINDCVALVKNIMNQIDGFSKMIENLTDFALNTTDQTKDLYEMFLKKLNL